MYDILNKHIVLLYQYMLQAAPGPQDSRTQRMIH